MTDSRLLLLSIPAGQCFPSRNSTATASRGSVRETAICRTIELVKLVWYGKGRVCRTNLSTQPRAKQSLPQPRVQQPRATQSRTQRPRATLPRAPAATSAAPSQAATSAARAQQPLPQPGPWAQGQSHAAQKTGPILCRRLLQTGYRTLSAPQ